jgi:hypothetical protein
MDGLVTSPASDQRFALPCRHQPEPGRNRLALVAVEVGHLTQMVNFNTSGAATQLARVSWSRLSNSEPLVYERGGR